MLYENMHQDVKGALDLKWMSPIFFKSQEDGAWEPGYFVEQPLANCVRVTRYYGTATGSAYGAHAVWKTWMRTPEEHIRVALMT